MRHFRHLAIAGALFASLLAFSPSATAQISAQIPCNSSIATGGKCNPAIYGDTNGQGQLVTQANSLPVTGMVATASATLTPSVSAAYVSGDIIANSGTAGSVTPLTLAVSPFADKAVLISRVRVTTADTAWASGTVRVHFYKTSPTVTNGDGGVFLSTESSYLGYAEVTLDRHFSDAEKGFGVPAIGNVFAIEPASGTTNIFGLIEARSSVTGTASKLWTVVLEVLR